MGRAMNNIQKTMLALAGRAEFPQGDKKFWISLWANAEQVEKLMCHIAECRNTRDEDMGKLVHMLEDHIKTELK